MKKNFIQDEDDDKVIFDIVNKIIEKTIKQSKHSKGQYFTTNKLLKQKVFEFITNNPQTILEPSIGRGDLIDFIQNQKQHKNIQYDLYEIDNHIELLPSMQKHTITYTDFLTTNITKKYDTIIGNPPYVKTKTGNLYVKFIEKCYNLLNENGELIFIVPSDMFKLTSMSSILEDMMKNGSFTDIFFPNDETLFEDANIDVIVFRYCKKKQLEKTALVNGTKKFITLTNGLLTFDDEYNEGKIIGDYFKAYVGLVSGKEAVYKKTFGNIDILRKEKCRERYILVDTFPSHNTQINNYLLENKTCLKERKIKKFNETNWFQWGAPRNKQIMEKYKGKECCYVYNLTRSSRVAFKGKVEYFSGNMIMLLPNKENEINLDDFVDYLNSADFQKNYIYSGRFKIGHRILLNSKFTI